MQTDMTQKDSGAKAALDKFLADNPAFWDLCAKLNTFNVFRALRIEKAEIRHSNVLGWLLDPEESHGLGNVVLRRVLSNILLETEVRPPGVSAAQIELMDLSDIEVRREWRNIDLLVIDRKNKLIVLFENKVRSKESPGQLRRYLDVVKKEFPQFSLMSVFLTRDGDEGEEDGAEEYAAYSYAKLLTVLERIYDQRESQLAEEVAVFLSQYLDTLRRLTMQDDTVAKLCKTIYRQHRAAIDLIFKYGMAGIGPQVAAEILSAEKGYEVLSIQSNRLWFMPLSWKEVLPENGTVWKHLSRPVSATCRFRFRDEEVDLIFELSRMDDPKLRLACAKALDKVGFKLTRLAFAENAKYSRFQRYSMPVEDRSDENEVRGVVENLLRKAHDQFAHAAEVFKGVFR